MERTSKWFAGLVRCLGIVMVGYLFLQGLFTVCTIQSVTERTFYVRSHALYGVVGIGVFVLVFWALYRFCGSILERCETVLVLAGMLLSALFLIWWLGQTQFWYWGDEEKIFQCAQQYLAGDYRNWKPGGYAYMWKHQNGMILFVAMLLSRFEMYIVYWIFRLLNVLFYELTIFFLWRTFRKIFADRRIAVIQAAMMLLFFPYGFYCVMFYGNVIGLGFAVLAIYLMVVYLEKESVGYLCGSAAAMILSIIFKQNDAIILVGLVLLMLLQPMAERKLTLRKAGAATAFVLAVVLGIQLPDLIVGARTGMNLSGTGNSIYAHIAMGLQDSEDAPGWYNTYNEVVFAEHGYDKKETARAAKQSLSETLRYYADNPGEGWSFIHRKLASEWNNPTFEGFHMQNARLTAEELSPIVKSTINDGGKLNILLTFFLDVYESVVLFGILLYLAGAKDADIRQLFFVMLLIGAFVFFAVWEAKGRYVAPFYLMAIPCAAAGYQKLLAGGRCFEATKKTALVTAVLAVLIFFCNVGVIDNSMKLGTQSEEYYEYIHEYNSNFINFRY
ncbi:MAG: glycosyltransferase family 39 protein [Acetatifactor sp.]|nr:glycosyltransferase family 39 protein [Acetatifactor sp.]